MDGEGEPVQVLGFRTAVAVGLLLLGLGCGPGDGPDATAVNSAIVPVERHDAVFVRRMNEMLSVPRRDSVQLLFLGDSITQGWQEEGLPVWSGVYAPHAAANFGIDGDRTQHVLWRLQAGALDGLSPRLVVLLIGTNNSETNTPEEVVEGIAAVLSELRLRLPGSRILLLALLPKHPDPESVARRRVDAINAKLPGLADGERVDFLDVGHVFLGPDRRIVRELMPDALHPSAEGYRRWSDAMGPTLTRLLAGG